jgi:hypothetical protein
VTPVQFLALFAEFWALSWRGWREDVLPRITTDVREVYVIAGRGSGKSRIAAVLACFAGSRSYRRVVGERIYVGVFAPDRAQARVTFRYVVGLLRSVPELDALIEAETRESVDLSNGVTIEVVTASTAAPRGRAYALCSVEEAAFLPAENSANPDVELIRALRPALARVAGSVLMVIGSPYARRGVLWTAVQRNAAAPDPRVLVVQKSTSELNPLFDAEAIERAYAEDPASANAEYGAQFRSDVEALFAVDALTACVVSGRFELPPVAGVTYSAFVDPSGGSADGFTLAIVHVETRNDVEVRVLDAVRERVPPFSPESVVAEFAALLKSYRIRTVHGDRYAGEWPREAFRKFGVDYRPSDRSKSDLYRDALPLVNSGRVDLLDQPKLIAQLTGLERRTARGGKDSIDHGPGGHDDVANAAAGALVLAANSEPNGIRVVHLLTGLPIDPRRVALARFFGPPDGDPLLW